ncbi:MAG: cytochrome c [Cyclobacteriaceae bacterium]|nr:cytochrome c [Cyclobacteriaceae bacterium HetDA_MAG_MS6]
MQKIKLLAITCTLWACGSAGTSGTEMDRETKIKYQQYLVQGKELYGTYCMNCHQENGQGLARLYPPLAKSDYLFNNIPRAACIVKNGQSKGITVNGVEYNQMMPGLGHLSNLEIAEILTYVTNSWGNENGLVSVQNVEKWTAACQTD